MKTVPAGHDLPKLINVIVEISSGSLPVKYEVDKDSGLLMVDRFLSVSMHYPCNYGYVPNTLAGDGDPLDVLLITPFPVLASAYICARPIGMLDMEDESGLDRKIVAVPTAKAAPIYAGWTEIDHVPEITKQAISHFFERYKDLEPGKWVKISGWRSRVLAEEEIMSAVAQASSASV